MKGSPAEPNNNISLLNIFFVTNDETGDGVIINETKVFKLSRSDFAWVFVVPRNFRNSVFCYVKLLR
jgi:hypothetical protein